MAWTYNDWLSQGSDAAQLTRLRLHIEEVSSEMSAEISSDGHSRNLGSLENYLGRLMDKLAELEALTGSGNRGVVRTIANFGSGG